MNEICYFLGGSSVDTILEVPRMPLPDEKLVARLAGLYVEIIRNLPLLLQLREHTP